MYSVMCDHIILLLTMKTADWISPGCLSSLHYWMVGSAGWLVDWVMIGHTGCQPSWLANWLRNWLPARLNDDPAYNTPLFLPAGAARPYNTNNTMTAWQTLDVTFMVKPSNGQSGPSCNAPLADHSPLPLRHRGCCSHGEINIQQWLSLTWRIGCKGLSQVHKRSGRQYMTFFFVERQQLSPLSEEELTDVRQLSRGIDQNMCIPRRRRPVSQKQEVQHISAQ